jgi:hypothetical protein
MIRANRKHDIAAALNNEISQCTQELRMLQAENIRSSQLTESRKHKTAPIDNSSQLEAARRYTPTAYINALIHVLGGRSEAYDNIPAVADAFHAINIPLWAFCDDPTAQAITTTHNTVAGLFSKSDIELIKTAIHNIDDHIIDHIALANVALLTKIQTARAALTTLQHEIETNARHIRN